MRQLASTTVHPISDVANLYLMGNRQRIDKTSKTLRAREFMHRRCLVNSHMLFEGKHMRCVQCVWSFYSY